MEFSDLEPIPINAGQANLKSHLTLDIPRTATDMNRTLHSDLRKSETGFTPPRPSEISEKKVSTYLGKAIFDIPFMIQSHAESMKKILGAL